MMKKPKYLVTYKDGEKEVVEGRIAFFSIESPSVPQIADTVYLNAAAVVSAIPQPVETGKEV